MWRAYVPGEGLIAKSNPRVVVPWVVAMLLSLSPPLQSLYWGYDPEEEPCECKQSPMGQLVHRDTGYKWIYNII